VNAYIYHNIGPLPFENERDKNKSKRNQSLVLIAVLSFVDTTSFIFSITIHHICAMAVAASACAASTFSSLSLLGAEILSTSATLVQNFTTTVTDQLYYNHPSITVKGVDYCNVTVTYTHPGQNDAINVEHWLPLNNWNGRFQAVGGGGYIAGRFSLSNIAMAGAIGEGYATSSSDAGLPMSYTPDAWAQVSDGNVNLYATQNLASVALNDQVRNKLRGHCAFVTCIY
jgi:hypothetical protein